MKWIYKKIEALCSCSKKSPKMVEFTCLETSFKSPEDDKMFDNVLAILRPLGFKQYSCRPLVISHQDIPVPTIATYLSSCQIEIEII